MRRFGQHAVLKADKVNDYIELHAAVWPEILEIIRDCNLCNYSIYISGCEVFSYFEYAGNNYDADMKRMSENVQMQKWWNHTKPCFVNHDKQEYYLDWKEIFHLE